MGFGSLFQYRCSQLDRVLCKELVDCFDVTQYMMYIRGVRIPVADEDVGWVFGIPSSGLDVQTAMNQDEKQEVEDVAHLRKKELEKVIYSGVVDNLFRRAFLLYILSVFFCPTTTNAPSPKLLPAVVDINNTAMYNWSKFILEWLVKEIKSYKKNRYSRHALGGCTFFLMIWYFHRRPLGSIGLFADRPLLKFWDSEKISKRGRLERKSE